jgi:hypothetical protein
MTAAAPAAGRREGELESYLRLLAGTRQRAG